MLFFPTAMSSGRNETLYWKYASDLFIVWSRLMSSLSGMLVADAGTPFTVSVFEFPWGLLNFL